MKAQAEIELATAAVHAAEAAVATAQANVSLAEAGKISRRRGLRTLAVPVCADQSTRNRVVWIANSKTRHEIRSRPRRRHAEKPSRRSSRPRLPSHKAKLMWQRPRPTTQWPAPRHGNAQADLSRVQALLRYTQIRAPYAGV